MDAAKAEKPVTWEQLGPYRLAQQEGLPKVSRDSLLLAEFATLRRGDRVFDLGCGVGVLGLSLARRETGLTLNGADCQPSCVRLTRENLRQNGLPGSIWELDVAELPERLPAGGYDLVIANPPYFQAGRGKTAPGSRGIARTGDEDGLEPWCRAARWLLRNGGRFALCARPWGLNALLAGLTRHQLEPKRLQPVQSAPDRPANLILLEAAAQGRPGLELLPVLIMR
ncbi:MAG: tRNA1(Val) (adenine(37)-N6)-methyltransferase [Candidatus Onthomonas sp.]